MQEVIEIVSIADFYGSKNKAVYQAMILLTAEKEPIDLVTVCHCLRGLGKLDETGGPKYLASLLDSVTAAPNPPHYARIIKEKAALRSLQKKSLDNILLSADND